MISQKQQLYKYNFCIIINCLLNKLIIIISNPNNIIIFISFYRIQRSKNIKEKSKRVKIGKNFIYSIFNI